MVCSHCQFADQYTFKVTPKVTRVFLELVVNSCSHNLSNMVIITKEVDTNQPWKCLPVHSSVYELPLLYTSCPASRYELRASWQTEELRRFYWIGWILHMRRQCSEYCFDSFNQAQLVPSMYFTQVWRTHIYFSVHFAHWAIPLQPLLTKTMITTLCKSWQRLPEITWRSGLEINQAETMKRWSCLRQIFYRELSKKCICSIYLSRPWTSNASFGRSQLQHVMLSSLGSKFCAAPALKDSMSRP